MNWESVFQYLGSSAIITTGLYYFLKSATDTMFKRNLEAFKINLDHQSKISQQEHQIKFSRLDEDRAEALKILYGMMFQQYRWLGILLISTPHQYKEKVIPSNRQFEELFEHYYKSRILLSEELIIQIDGVIDGTRKIINDIDLLIADQEQNPHSRDIPNRKIEISKAITDSTINHMRPVEIEFRKILSEMPA